MRNPPFLFAALVAALCLAPAARAGDARSSGLEKDSAFEYGCFGPCACPILVQSGLAGGFALNLRGFDGLFYVYDVLDVHWAIPTSGDSLRFPASSSHSLAADRRRTSGQALRSTGHACHARHARRARDFSR